MFKKEKRFLMLILLSLVLCVAGCGEKAESALVIAMQEFDGVFNPFYSSTASDGSIVGMTQISMLSSDSAGKVTYGEDEPCVVLDYTQETEGVGDEQKTVYRFVLKNNIKFSDGTPLTMKDVLFNLYEYLDPLYYGSATLYSTDIVGLSEYRTQTANKAEQEKFNENFAALADDRVQRLVEIAEIVLDEATKTLSFAEFRAALYSVANEFGTDYTTVAEDFDLACSEFLKELESDFANAKDSADSIKFLNAAGKEVSLTNDVEAFLYNEGYISWNKEEKIFEYSYGASSKNWTKEQAIETVYNTKIPNSIIEIVSYWQTATNLREYFANLEKEKYFTEIDRDYKNISGIRFLNKDSEAVVDGKTYPAPQYGENGAITNDTHEILEIEINGVDPKAIWNFAFTVAPMSYYSSSEEIAKFDFSENFGVRYSSQKFQDEVIKDNSKIGLPVGAGPYKACNKERNDKISSGGFSENNVVYFQSNDYFLLGKPKIKYINYQVFPTNQLLSALYAGDVDYVEPSANTENIQSLERNKSKGFKYITEMTNGYGYIGINSAKIPDVNVRRAIMHAVDVQLCLDYYPGYASPIYRPMTKASWAYPELPTDQQKQYYEFDATGAVSEQLVKDAGYTIGGDGVYAKNGHRLKYTFTISGDTTDHPAYQALKRASDILNEHGFSIVVQSDSDALKKLNSGALTVWAAAWGGAIDPDMYQVYHMDSTATSTLNWGYKAILNNKTKYEYEYNLIVELSEQIENARSILDETRRAEYYADALDIVMDLAVELPTYQRSDLFAYNTKKIDEKSLPKDISPYNGPLSRIWEISFKED